MHTLSNLTSLDGLTRRDAIDADRPSWKILVDAVAAATDPLVRRNTEVVLRHVAAEVAGDVDALMSTLVSEPVYRVWGASTSTGPVGAAEVRAHYQRMIKDGKNRLEYVVERVVADDRCVVTEGEFRFAYLGASLTAAYTEAGESVEPSAWYYVAYRCVVLWPFDGSGLLTGEEIYAGEAPRALRRLDDGEMPHLGPLTRRSAAT